MTRNTNAITITATRIERDPANVALASKLAKKFKLNPGTSLDFAQMASIYYAAFGTNPVSGVTAATADDKANRFKVIKAYSKLDKLFHNVGISMRSKNYYSKFNIVTVQDKDAKVYTPRTKATIERISIAHL